MKTCIKLHHICVSILILSGSAQWAAATILSSPGVGVSSPPFDASFAKENAADNTEAEFASDGRGNATIIDFRFSSPQTFDKIVVINRDSSGQSDLIANFDIDPPGEG